MNPLALKDIKGYHFVIPRYQRGYRWEEEQVNMLITDLLEAYENLNDSREKDKFYCLQPVVVVPIDKEKKIYEVVDGQQRLTTLWLLFNYLKGYGGEDFYTLEFTGRPNQQNFIDNKKFLLETDDYENNIDNFYLKKAYQTICKLLDNNNSRQYEISKLCQIDKDWKKGKPYAAVLWHEITEKNALQAFKDLNYGKIPLTSTEIIKAILVQKDCYNNDEIAKKKAEQRSTGWENLSLELNKLELKGMIADRETDILEEVVKNVADKINLQQNYNFKRKSENKYVQDLFDYYVINEYFKIEIQKGKERNTIANEVWEKIQGVSNKILNWYENRTFYHLIGLYSLLGKKSGADLISELLKIEDESQGNKEEFIRLLKKRISDRIKIPILKDDDGNILPDDKQGLSSPRLIYGVYDDLLRRILTAFNVWSVETQHLDERRFPFGLFRKDNPSSLEHIHPKSIEDGDQKEYVSWLETKRSNIDSDIYNELSNLIQDEKNFEQNRELINSLIEKSIAKLDRDEYLKWIKRHIDEMDKEQYHSLILKLENEDTIEDAKQIISKLALEKNESIIDLKRLENGVHQIRNLALVDVVTNSELQFNNLDIKRNILEEKSVSGQKFIPPATLDVFSKKFSAKNPGDMRYWLEYDRQKYFEKIKEAYKYFTDTK